MSWLRWVRRGLFALVAFAVLIVGVTAGRVWWEGRQDHHPVSDVIIVLGAAQYNGDPSPVFAARLDHAQQLFKDKVAAHVLTVGGGQPGDRTTEGAAGAAYLRANGLPGAALEPVPTGSNTLDSLRAAAELMKANGWHSAVIVSDSWHALRAGTMAGDLGIDAHVSPVAATAGSTNAGHITHETLGYLYYSLFGTDNAASVPAAR
ncbi:MAG: hypothetical protein JWM93_3524 [Frankiales bacterium]|nr:hypothetical protein [Frankiales bacterium]